MFPRKVGDAWEIQAPAKLNLCLEVLGRRDDGFHSLQTLMVPVRVYDQLRYRSAPARELELRVRNLLPQPQAANLLGSNDNNLILRAARMLGTKAEILPKGTFELIKRIPIQAGMGGGSSDAAAALLLMNKAWNLNYPLKQLAPLAAELGSDVPFFLGHGAAVCRGRGELIEPIDRLPKMHFVVAKPPQGSSTAEVFGCLPSTDQSITARESLANRSLHHLVQSLQLGTVAQAGRWMTNRLEDGAAQLAPWLTRLRELFAGIGCLAHFMTGSGSAYVGVMRSAHHARHTAQRLRNLKTENGFEVGHVFATSSC